ncbi:hypothetical protein NQZ79_g1832 [Umbelopsis isabellina]|nr:hypothetical protein NQZ79_g1832 [Umbelopsis isabellina]
MAASFPLRPAGFKNSHIHCHRNAFGREIPPDSKVSFSVLMDPIKVLELQSLTKVANEKNKTEGVEASIPYLAKIVQILDTHSSQRSQNNTASTIQAIEHKAIDARKDYADALFATHRYTECEVQMGLVCKTLERYLKRGDITDDLRRDLQSKLLVCYPRWADCYENLGNSHLASKVRQRTQKFQGQTVT